MVKYLVTHQDENRLVEELSMFETLGCGYARGLHYLIRKEIDKYHSPISKELGLVDCEPWRKPRNTR